MSLRRTIRRFLFLTPLLLFAMLVELPQYSARLSLVQHGYPFANLTPCYKIDVYKLMSNYNVRVRSIAFSDGKPVGYIYQGIIGLARFEPISNDTSPEGVGVYDPCFDGRLITAWSWRWWLLAVQFLLLLLWFGLRRYRVQ